MSEWLRWVFLVILVVFCIYYVKWNEKIMPSIWHKIGLQKRTEKIKKIKKNINGKRLL